MANPGNGTILSSDWTGLNPLLIAKFFAVDEKGVRLPDEQIEVHAPISESNMEATFNWQSPFEAASPDTKAPAIAGMLQSGALATILADATGMEFVGTRSAFGQKAQNVADSTLEQLKGRTGITKLNSIQIFTGMAPVKFQMTLHFRAMSDPYREVDAPIGQILAWAAPRKLSSDSIVQRLSRTDESGGIVKALMPSLAPQMIAVQYKNEQYGPLVIESVSNPLTANAASNGFHTEKMLTISLASLTALDRDDFKKMVTLQP